MASQFYAKIETPISITGVGIADDMLNKINQFRQSIDQIKEQNLDLERMRDQYIIHLQQCQEDHEILRNLYKNLKQKLDFLNFQSEQQKNVPQHQPTVPAHRPVQVKAEVPPPVIAKHTKKAHLVNTFTASGIICSVAYNRAGTLIAFSTGSILFILNSADGNLNDQIGLPAITSADDHCRSITFSPDGSLIAMTCYPNKIYIINIKTKTITATLSNHTKEVSSLIFSSDGKRLISGGFDGLIIIWDASTFVEIKRLNVGSKDSKQEAIIGIASSPDPSFYAIATSSGNVFIYQSDFLAPAASFSAHTDSMLSIAVSPLDEFIATASKDKTVKVWSFRVQPCLKDTLKGHTDCTLAVAFSPHAQILITGSMDQTIRMWNYKKGKELGTLQAHENTVFAIAHHPEENRFVSVGGDCKVCIWDYNN